MSDPQKRNFGSLTHSGLYNLTFKERPKRPVTFQTFYQSDEETCPDQHFVNFSQFWQYFYNIYNFDNLCQFVTILDLWQFLTVLDKDNPRGLWHLRHWLQFWQLRTWNHDNLCYLTINCDTGQHSQFLRCFIKHVLLAGRLTRIQPFMWKKVKITSSPNHSLLARETKMVCNVWYFP